MDKKELAARISKGRAWLICHKLANCWFYGFEQDYPRWRKNLAHYEKLVDMYVAMGGDERKAWKIPKDTPVEDLSLEQSAIILIGLPPMKK